MLKRIGRNPHMIYRHDEINTTYKLKSDVLMEDSKTLKISSKPFKASRVNDLILVALVPPVVPTCEGSGVSQSVVAVQKAQVLDSSWW